MENDFLIIHEKRLKAVLQEVLSENELKRKAFEEKEKQAKNLYSINKVAKMLGRSHSKIKKLVEQNILKATADGLISEKSINEYLKSE